MDLQELRQTINEMKTERSLLMESLEEKQEEQAELEQEIEDIRKAQAILQTAAEKTQEKIEIHLSSIVTLALETVFREPYKFITKFVSRRGKTECDLMLEKNDVQMSPEFSSGGGVMDVVSFALRIAYWKLEHTSSVIVLDEPFKMLSQDLVPRICEILKMISKSFGIQLIIVTHIEKLTECADKVFRVHGGKVEEAEGAK